MNERNVAGAIQTPVADALESIRDYFEDRADASCEPGDDRFRGNKEMSMLTDVEQVELGFVRLTEEVVNLRQRLSEASSSLRLHNESTDTRVLLLREALAGCVDALGQLEIPAVNRARAALEATK